MVRLAAAGVVRAGTRQPTNPVKGKHKIKVELGNVHLPASYHLWFELHIQSQRNRRCKPSNFEGLRARWP